MWSVVRDLRVVLILAAAMSSVVLAYSGGDGTARNPYQIANKADLLQLGATPEDYGKCFVLTADIDLGGETFVEAVIAPDIDSSDTDFQGTAFCGTFDGNHYTIMNLGIYCEGQDYLGFFGQIGSGGEVHNLGINNIALQGGLCVGGLAGYNSGTIRSCHVKGAVGGDTVVGGLAGYNDHGVIESSFAMGSVSGFSYSFSTGGLVGYNFYGVITSCYTTNSVGGYADIGGLAGTNYYGSITSCYATGLVSGSSYSVGGLVGTNHRGTILSCYYTHAIEGYAWVGGIAGSNSGTIISCYTSCFVSGLDSCIGGLVGYNYSHGTITSCHAATTVHGSDFVGGLVGENYSGAITDSYASGTIGGHSSIGGLAGYNNSYGTITSCYATGSVIGSDSIGGLVGENPGIIVSCYASGYVGGTSYSSIVGGLVGENSDGRIMFCYARGWVYGDSYNIGGLTGRNENGSVLSSFWNIITSGQMYSSGGIGKTTNQLKDPTTFIDAGWDFTGEREDGLHDYWQMDTGNYPRLASFSWTLQGEGTSVSPYLIANAADLGKIWLRPAACYQLANNLDLSGISWSTAVISPFTGVFDGRGFVISTLLIDQKSIDYIGLFGLTFDATIQDLGVVEVNITGGGYVGGLAGSMDSGRIKSCYATGSVNGSKYYTGGLVGRSSGTIEFCYSGGAVSGNYSVGGLVGEIDSGYITACNASGSVRGHSQVGGLAGLNREGRVSSSFALEFVYGYSYIGGLCGWNSGCISQTYASGGLTNKKYVGGLCGYLYGDSAIIEKSFWDIETSGLTTGIGSGSSNGVYGKTTVEMRRLLTYLEAGWDFAGEAVNGTVDVWRMCSDGVGYPQLSWEFGRRGDFACPDGVGVEDLEALGMAWLTAEGQTGYRVACDANSDGRIDMTDFEMLAGEWIGN